MGNRFAECFVHMGRGIIEIYNYAPMRSIPINTRLAYVLQINRLKNKIKIHYTTNVVYDYIVIDFILIYVFENMLFYLKSTSLKCLLLFSYVCFLIRLFNKALMHARRLITSVQNSKDVLSTLRTFTGPAINLFQSGIESLIRLYCSRGSPQEKSRVYTVSSFDRGPR